MRISVPSHITDDNVRLAVVEKLSWIKKQQEEFRKQPRQTEREYVSGESHYVQGKRYLLEVIENPGKHVLELKNNGKMVLSIRPNTSKEKKALVVNSWYRQQIKRIIPELLNKWQPIIGKEVDDLVAVKTPKGIAEYENELYCHCILVSHGFCLGHGLPCGQERKRHPRGFRRKAVPDDPACC